MVRVLPDIHLRSKCSESQTVHYDGHWSRIHGIHQILTVPAFLILTVVKHRCEPADNDVAAKRLKSLEILMCALVPY